MITISQLQNDDDDSIVILGRHYSCLSRLISPQNRHGHHVLSIENNIQDLIAIKSLFVSILKEIFLKNFKKGNELKNDKKVLKNVNYTKEN